MGLSNLEYRGMISTGWYFNYVKRSEWSSIVLNCFENRINQLGWSERPMNGVEWIELPRMRLIAL